MAKIGVYRIVGSELPGRDVAGTRVRVTDHILRTERLPSNVQKHWVMNRVAQADVRRQLHALFDSHNAHVTDFPLSVEAVKQAVTFADKVKTAIEINEIRNWAIADGKARGYDWTVVLDGDCAFTPQSFSSFEQVCLNTQQYYIGIPSRRCIVYGDGTTEPVGDLGEPMLAFAKASSRTFNTRIPFGQGEKLQLLIDLGFSAVEGQHTQLAANALATTAGWVNHVCLDVARDVVEKVTSVREALRMSGLRSLIDAVLAPQPRHLYAQFNKEWESIEGFFDFEGPYSGLAADVPDGWPIVEVGSWLGKSATYLAREIELRGKTNKLYCVDSWSGEPDLATRVTGQGGRNGMIEKFLYNTRNHRGRIIPLPMQSATAAKMFADESLIAVFIDANHTYDAVKADLHAWYPKVCPGGIICGHDYVPNHKTSINDVVRAVDEFFTDRALELRPYSRVWKHVKQGGGPRLWS